ncbi:hypothetical protein [Actinoplanes sp. NPDC026619]|uniref:hypothetical protein n=1 Tax=Actinoplanes sp. NPDC026619 TaxID=3155798 RepID=UPI0033FCB31A
MKRSLTALAVLATTAGVFAVPTAAFAAQNNDIGGEVYTNGGWTPGHVTRHKTDTGDIKVKITNNVDGGICLRLRSTTSNSVFAGPVCWVAGEYTAKFVATDVLRGTDFTIEAKKRVATGTNNEWAGIANY